MGGQTPDMSFSDVPIDCRGGQRDTFGVRPPTCLARRRPDLRLAAASPCRHASFVARKRRVEAPGAIHHVVAKGNAGQAIVRDDDDRGALVRRLARAFELHGWSCWSYCLMDSHFHLVVETPEPNLGIGMKWLSAAHAQDFNQRYERCGHVFGGRFYSQLIERDAHLLEACVYVVLNPVRAGVVEHPRQWSWSSFRSAAGLAPTLSSLSSGHLLDFIDVSRDIAQRRFVSVVEGTLERDRLREARGCRAPFDLT